MDETRTETKMETSKPLTPTSGVQDPKTDIADLSASTLAGLQSDVQPVGHDYVEEVSADRQGIKINLTSPQM